MRFPNPFAQHATQEPWEARWHALSTPARLAYLEGLQHFRTARMLAMPFKNLVGRQAAPLVDELRDAGFLQSTGEPRVANETLAFAGRLAVLQRSQVLRDPTRQNLHGYLQEFFPHQDFYRLVERIRTSAKVSWRPTLRDVERFCLPTHHWIDWVRKLLASEDRTQALLDALVGAAGPLHLTDLGRLVPELSAKGVRKAYEVLFAHLVAFEDVDPTTGVLLMGLLPGVRDSLERQAHPVPRPPLQPQPTPTVLAPEGSDLADLRAFLLELIASPARLRQGGQLYQKDVDRLAQALEPLPEWLKPESAPGTSAYLDDDADVDEEEEEDEALIGNAEQQVQRAFTWARVAELTVASLGGEKNLLQVSKEGHAWLQLPFERQFTVIAERLRREPNLSDYEFRGDGVFLAATTSARLHHAGSRRPDLLARMETFRRAVYHAFRELPAGTYVRVTDFLAHATHGAANPLLLGQAAGDVVVYNDYREVPPLEAALEKVGRVLLQRVMDYRLVPFGALRLGMNAAGEKVIARTPRLDLYFGFQPDPKEFPPAPVPQGPARVVVQPDFSVIVIGQDPAPAADLLPFCERARGSVDQGSLLLRITRETVLRAVTQGLPGKTILERLQKHSSTPLPANVLEEVRGWCALMARVRAAPATLIRCADSAVADRVVQALGKNAERIAPTVVAVNAPRLTPALRQRLQAQGIAVEGASEATRWRSGKK